MYNSIYCWSHLCEHAAAAHVVGGDATHQPALPTDYFYCIDTQRYWNGLIGKFTVVTYCKKLGDETFSVDNPFVLQNIISPPAISRVYHVSWSDYHTLTLILLHAFPVDKLA